MESVTGSRSTVQSQNQCRFSRTRFFDTLITFIEHSLHTTIASSGQYDISDFQSTVRYQYRSYITTSLVKWRLDNRSRSVTVRVCLQVEHFGFQQYLFQQIFHSHTFLGRDILWLILTTPFFNKVIHSSQFFFNLIRICSRFIHLIDSKHNRYTRRHCMVDGLLCLRHHVIIRRYNNNRNIRYFRTTGTHSGKRLMSRSIKECNTATVFQLHIVCTDMLCDTSGFTGNHIRLTDIVKQWSLTMVNMSHYSNNRSTRLQIFRSIFFFHDSLCHFRTYIFGLETKFFGHQIDCFRIQTLVDRNHDANTHTSSNNLVDRNVHHCS